MVCSVDRMSYICPVLSNATELKSYARCHNTYHDSIATLSVYKCGLVHVSGCAV